MESELAARNGGRAGIIALVAILLLGVGLRVGEAWDGRAPVYDAKAYAAIAANLDRGHGFTVGPSATQPSGNYSPGLPLFAAGLYELTGGVHERFARVVLAVIGALSILFTYLIGRRLWRCADRPQPGVVNLGSVVAGLIGAAVVAIYPALLEYQGMLMSEPLAATLLSGAALSIFWAADRDRRARWLVPGASLGGLAMVRPEYLGVAVLVAIVVFLRGRRSDWRRSFAQAAVLLAGVVIVVAPWTIRNAAALDRFVPISTGGGQVLFAGTYLPSDGDPEKVGAAVVAENPRIFSPADARKLRLEQILATLAAHTYPELESDEALSKMGKEQLWDDVSEEPLEYLGFVATKIGRIWSHGPRDVMREPLWEALHWALLVFGLIGLTVLAWRRRWEALLIAVILLAITAISALLVASPRRVLVMLPLLAALAGSGVVFAWAWAQTLKRRPGSLSRP
jgi:4-amino-4-deoxy-L-arabinose transferase-like glycosyltransferase